MKSKCLKNLMIKNSIQILNLKLKIIFISPARLILKRIGESLESQKPKL